MGIVREENKREEKRKEERRSEKRKCQKKKMQVGECRVPSEEHRVSIFFGISSAFSFLRLPICAFIQHMHSGSWILSGSCLPSIGVRNQAPQCHTWSTKNKTSTILAALKERPRSCFLRSLVGSSTRHQGLCRNDHVVLGSEPVRRFHAGAA